MIVAGIDEAGFGPVLGPMLVAATAFSMPAELADQSMWQLLSAAVSRRPAKRAARIAIADSKKLYNRQKPDALKHLERGVLAMLAARDCRATDLRQLLAAVCPSALGQLERYPWYGQGPRAMALPRAVSPTSIELCANNLAERMRQSGVGGPLTMRAEVVFEGEFNRLVQATDNKSVVLLDVVSRLLMHLWKLSAGQDMRIVVDRQGGRRHYLEHLQRLFAGCAFKVLDESESLSAYSISDGRRKVEVFFLVEAEDQHLPVALASMLCKYLRELFMELFNGYWGRYVPQIEPTAGYYVDGQRFWRQIAPHVGQMGLSESMIYRSR